jgi:hypothetical protein
VPLVAWILRGEFNREDFVVLQELLEAGKVTPVIDRRYALSELPEALRYLGEGGAQRKGRHQRVRVSTCGNSTTASSW